MSLRFAERMGRLGTESAFEVLARARRLEAQGRRVLHLEIGEPDFPTPDNIVEAAVAAIHDGATHYTPASGLLLAREATAEYVARRTGIAVSPEQVVLTPGSKLVLLFTLWSLVEPGEEVLVPDPGYPIYRSLVEFLGARPVGVPLREDNQFRLDVDELRSLLTPRSRVLVVNTPANPTGGCLSRSDCEAIAEIAMERDLVVVSDEIYSRLVYDGDHVSIYSIPGMAERTVLMDGLSKAWAMCGWRLGYAVAPLQLARRMDTLMINTASCAAAFTQLAAVEAFTAARSDTAVQRMVEEFRRRREVIVAGLRAIPGVRCHLPEGAFYVFPSIRDTGWDERQLAEALLEEVGVAVLAGSAFGEGGRGFLRLSYATSVADIQVAVRRIADFLDRASPRPTSPAGG